MGKKGKGKKKEKITGTPDVVRFKGTREFQYLRECVAIQESLPFVASDILDDVSFKRVARFLNMVGLLAEFSQAEASKEYRFVLHHHLLEPVPHYCPFGYSAGIIKAARQLVENPAATFNGIDFPFPDALRAKADKFLKDIDSSMMTKVAAFIEAALKDDFAAGLKKFKWDLRDLLTAFDAKWIGFEKEYLQTMFDAHCKVFVPIEELIRVEKNLTIAEEECDISTKQKLEHDLVTCLEDLTNSLIPETQDRKFPDDVMSLAESVLFYESKCTEEWQNDAKYIIKDYLKIRIFLTNLASTRMSPEFIENTKFVRLLKSFHQSVMDAYAALDFVSKLPKLIHAKTSNWMTRSLLEPDLEKQEEQRVNTSTN